ncbi:MAG: TonB-dependent receptor [Bacteroidetes bacterium]|nr:TonB-dependent receptor [Bacteroidota bacterium]
MQRIKLLLTLVVFVLFSGTLMSQGQISGVLQDEESNETLIGATVLIEGTTSGVVTDMDGSFLIIAPEGEQTLVFRYVGYDEQKKVVTVENGKTIDLGKISLKPNSILLDGIDIIADRAKERETPVAVSNVTKAEIEQQLGSQDLPMVMNNTPSVYATPQGGGAGDARINVRGFNQRNVAIMINGVPINDMENGWVYWSNWDGVADVTSSIQMQRGLSAVNLATPSVGGTMNILTSPAEMKAGGSGKFEYGSGNFFKATLSAHTGLINNKFAASVSAVRKVGQGVIDKTWTDAWAYYVGMSYNVSKNHRLEFYAIGAPQKHGQNLYKQNVAAYSHEYAEELGVADSTLLMFKEATTGRLYNENWNVVDENYDGEQNWNGKNHERHDPGFINERENYYHKPVVNLNWYAQWSKKVTQFTTVYYSGGKGGGSGTYGKIQYNYDQEPTRIPDWNSTIEHNRDPEYTREGILRNSTNNQNTIGAISKVKINFSDHFKGQVGLDWRTAKIEHFRDVRDLLGLNTFYFDGNEFDSEADYNKGLGDKIDYFNTNTVDWFGGYLQGEYTNGKLSAYATFGYSMIKYSYVNHFVKGDDGGELKSNTDWIGGYQVKGGVNYNFTETFSAFGNVGVVSKVPIFDDVIDDGDGTVAEDPNNEQFVAYEAGVIFTTRDDKLDLKGNFYYTTWNDRTFTRSVRITEETTGIAFIRGMDQRHVGFEFEGSYRPVRFIGFGAIASIANWEYLKDVSAVIKDYEGGITTDTVNVYAEGLKVGDAPQTQFALWTNIYPVKGLNIQLLWRYNANHYADFNPTTRTDENDTEQVWKTPSYSVFDAHVYYTLPLKGKLGVDVFAHVFNIFNTFYVQDAVDNSAYNGFYGYDDRYSHTVNSAEVFLGLPTTFNVGVKISFQ